jgi:hypothetical protein
LCAAAKDFVEFAGEGEDTGRLVFHSELNDYVMTCKTIPIIHLRYETPEEPNQKTNIIIMVEENDFTMDLSRKFIVETVESEPMTCVESKCYLLA